MKIKLVLLTLRRVLKFATKAFKSERRLKFIDVVSLNLKFILERMNEGNLYRIMKSIQTQQNSMNVIMRWKK